MKSVMKFQVWVALLLLGAGLAVSGCKSTPPLSQADAQKIIEAYNEQQPPIPVHIYVDYTGLKQGVDAKYWKVVKQFPANKYWGDLELRFRNALNFTDRLADVVVNVQIKVF